MDSSIVFTPQDIINVALALCGAIITISGAGTIIIRAIAKAREPNKVQDERLAKLEEDVRNIRHEVNTNARENIHQLKLYEDRVSEIELAQKEINMIMLASQKAIISHALDGNNKDALRNSEKQIDTYLIDKAS